MKRYMIFTLLIIMIVITGCGKKNDIVNADLAVAFADSELFAERLEEITASSAESRYGLSRKDYSELTAFVGTKSNCDEFVIIKTTDTENIRLKINKYLEEKIEDYELYRSGEVYKLTKPLVLEYNGTVVIVICHDINAAERVYKEYLRS